MFFFRYFVGYFVIILIVIVSEYFVTLVIVLAILLLIKSPVVSAVFWIILFEEVLGASVADFLMHSLSQIFEYLVGLNSASFFIFYTLINN